MDRGDGIALSAGRASKVKTAPIRDLKKCQRSNLAKACCAQSNDTN